MIYEKPLKLFLIQSYAAVDYSFALEFKYSEIMY